MWLTSHCDDKGLERSRIIKRCGDPSSYLFGEYLRREIV